MRKTSSLSFSTPFYKGDVQCCVIDKPVCDLNLGNLSGVLDERKLLVSPAVGPSVDLVTMHARKIADTHPTKPLVTPKPPELHVDHHRLVKLQAEEAALRPLFAKAEYGIVHHKLNGSVCFRIANGLLHRLFVDASGETSQLLVPSSLRESVLLSDVRSYWCCTYDRQRVVSVLLARCHAGCSEVLSDL